MPEIGIAENPTDPRFIGSMLARQFDIEMIKTGLHVRSFDAGKLSRERIVSSTRRRVCQTKIILVAIKTVRGRPFLVMITGSRTAASGSPKILRNRSGGHSRCHG